MSTRRLLTITAVGLLLTVAGCGSAAIAAGEQAALSFGLMADVQYADRDTQGGRHYRQSLANLEACVADLNTQDLAFTIQLGDIVDRGPESLDRVLSVFNRLDMPKYHVLGNHDFPLPRQDVLAKLEMEQAYYTFSLGGWRFVVLDTADVSMEGGWPEDSDHYRQAKHWLATLQDEGKPYAEPWNGGIGEEQKRRLKETLDDASSRAEKVIVFGHMPLLAEASEEWALLYNHDEIREILESSGCVAAYFCGHDHAGGYAERSGIHHLTLQGMVEAPEENAYAVVDLYHDRIEIRGAGKVPSRVLTFSHCKEAAVLGS